MKVLAIIGSPKKGNTYRITQQVENNLKSFVNNNKRKVDLEFDYLFLKDAQLELCKGCFTCIPRGEENCPLKDSRADIEKRILASNGIILASPVYSMNVPWLMKNFMDRFAYTLHRPTYINQKLMLLITAGEVGMKMTLKSLSNTMGGSYLVSKLAVKTPPFKFKPKYEKSITRDIEKASRKFYRALKSDKPLPPTFVNVLWFQAFKIQSEKTKHQFPADYNFYKDKENFFYETKVNRMKTYFAKLMLRLFSRGFDKKFDTI
ncbi:MAG: flavodoxin family protein [Candidatus Lokiarchaeota archaeon]